MKERQSNIELLRLVCMFLIILIHYTGHCIFVQSETYAQRPWNETLFPQIIHDLCWCAVNTFIIISGFFSIRPKAKSFFSFYVTCAFYAGLLYVIHLYLTGSHLNRWVLYNTIMPFGLWKSSSNWWFIPNYLILYILSPILNKLIDTITKREMQYFIILQAIVVFYFGWYRNEEWNEMGLNFINFIFLYFVGRYLRLSVNTDISHHNNNSLKYLFLWTFLGVFMGVADWYVFFYKPNIPWLWYIRQYNSPFTIAEAVCLFLAFYNMNITYNKTINYLAASALPIYLLHNNNYIISQWQYRIVTYVYDSQNNIVAYLILFGLAVALCIMIPILDKVRIVITNPVSAWLCRVYYKSKPQLNIILDKCLH